MIHGFDEIERQPNLAIKEIAENLNCGALKIFLGAGISQGFGLPSWDELIQNVYSKYHIQKKFSGKPYTIDEIKDFGQREKLQLLNDIEKEKDFLKIVHSSLYENIGDKNLTEKFIFSAPTLLAISAFCVGTMRGRVDHIFTFNYDDLLEQYLMLIGLRADSKDKYYEARSRADVRIDHIHGFLPQGLNKFDAQEIIFSDNSYTKRTRELTESVSAWITNQMIGYTGLYVGLSGEDDLLGHLLHFENKEKSKFGTSINTRNGYFILTPSAYTRQKDKLIENNICPIKLEKEMIPNFLLSCCQKASEIV